MTNTAKKGILLPVVLDKKFARSDEECAFESLEIPDHVIQESVRADGSGGYHAAPVSVEKSRISDSLYFALGDIFALLVSSSLASIIASIAGGSFAIRSWMLVLLPLWMIAAGGLNLYPGWGLTSVEEVRRTSITTSIAYATIAVMALFTNAFAGFGPLSFVLGYLFAIPLVYVIRGRVARSLVASGRGGQNTVIYGASQSGIDVLHSIRSDYRSGMIPIAFLDDDPGRWGQSIDGIPVLGDTNLVIPEADAAVIALPRSSKDNLNTLLNGPLSYYQRIVSIPEWDSIPATGIRPFDDGRFFGLELAKSPIHPDNRGSKRMLDIVLTICIAPAALAFSLLIGTLVWLDTRSNPFQAYSVRSANRSQMWLYKFAPALRYRTFLSRTGLLHLPALFNVLMGDLSLVGPAIRDAVPGEDMNNASAREDANRGSSGKGGASTLRIRPGLTGLFFPPLISSKAPKDEDAALRYYVRRWSVWMDMIVIGHATQSLVSSWLRYR